ncbi:hypothetical protein [Endozoicomonas sp. 8E]|uniref:hypothetical protein n=1 Tax=Endozoicomonas sp. 8E TaxID=3035692 RepID=UPI002939187A|nr:hypothetical protein [Endozoicomonas sp. 8E]WOG27084.1 hypothetical protein P6910_21415 [Endozoicomonas sp. 8E]
MFLLLTLSLPCQAEPWTRRFIVEFEQDTGSPDQGFYIKRDQHTLPENPSDTICTSGHPGFDSPTDDIPQKSCSYGVKTTIVDVISWQWLYTTDLLAVYELILTTRDAPLFSNPYSWLPSEAILVLGWLLKSYWNPNSPMFNPIEPKVAQQEANQNQPFATINAMFGSGNNQQQCQPSASSGQQFQKASNHLTGSFNSLVNIDYRGGNGGPQEQSHTLGLNCFIYPCRGVCRLRPLSVGSEPTEWALSSEESSKGQSSCTHPVNECRFSCIGHFDLAGATYFQQKPPVEIWINPRATPATHLQYNSDQLFGLQPHDMDDSFIDGVASDGVASDGIASEGVTPDSKNAGVVYTTDPARPLNFDVPMLENVCFSSGIAPSKGASHGQKNCPDHKSEYRSEQPTCKVTVVREDGQQRPCGMVFKNIQALVNHKRRAHTGPQACYMTVVREDGRQQPCGQVCKNALSLSVHESKVHSGQKTCDATVIGVNGQKHLCGRICKNAGALSDHKIRKHSGQQTCDVRMVGEDGQQRLCGKICKSLKTLSYHKRTDHGRQQTCDEIMLREDGRQQPCGAICKGSRALSDHKKRHHSGQKTCDIALVGDDGQQWPCGKVCKNIHTLTYHKKTAHSRQQTYNVKVLGEDAQLRSLVEVCQRSIEPSNHRRIHRKLKPVDEGREDDSTPQKGK